MEKFIKMTKISHLNIKKGFPFEYLTMPSNDKCEQGIRNMTVALCKTPHAERLSSH